MEENKIAIIGAGIGGLTTAIALAKHGIDFVIFESFTTRKDLGAGIMLANNAMQVYEKLEIEKEIEAKGNRFDSLCLRDPKMNLLTRSSTTAFSENKVNTIAIHRSELQEVLWNNIPAEKIRLGKKLEKLEEKTDGVLLCFSDGTTYQAKLVLGGDGIHSAVRNAVLPGAEIRDAQQDCRRGIASMDLPSEFNAELNEIWDKGARFGFVQIAPHKVYWYALQDKQDNQEMSRAVLLERFGKRKELLRHIIEATPEEKILENPLKDLKPLDNWSKGRVCLMGDAAHATTPNLGQGACQAIEDALVIAHCLAKKKSFKNAFEQFQQLRMKKANWVVKQSWRVGKLSHMKNTIGVGLRNLLLKNAPKSMQRKQNAFLFKLAELD